MVQIKFHYDWPTGCGERYSSLKIFSDRHTDRHTDDGPPVLEKKIFDGFLRHGGHLCHVTSIMSSDFHFLVPESFHKKIGSDWQSSF